MSYKEVLGSNRNVVIKLTMFYADCGNLMCNDDWHNEKTAN